MNCQRCGSSLEGRVVWNTRKEPHIKCCESCCFRRTFDDDYKALPEPTKRGRPKQFRNAAEKQKAYRERKKQQQVELEALRKSEYENSLEGLRDKVLELHIQCEKNLAACTKVWPRDGSQEQALAERPALVNTWWEAHQVWYEAWKAAGYPSEGKYE